MTFEETLDHAMAMLRLCGGLTYGTLKRQFLDDAALEVLKNEPIEGQRLAVDEDGEILVWTGSQASAPLPTVAPARSQDRARLVSIPPYLAEKILTSESALEGEHKQVTALFADLEGAMEYVEQTMVFLDGTRRRERFGELIFPAVFTPAHLAWCHAELGTFTEGSTLAGRRAHDG